MSLINEALRKIQSQQAKGPAWQPESGTPGRYPHPKDSSRSRNLLILAGGLFAVAMAILALALTLLFFKPADPADSLASRSDESSLAPDPLPVSTAEIPEPIEEAALSDLDPIRFEMPEIQTPYPEGDSPKISGEAPGALPSSTPKPAIVTATPQKDPSIAQLVDAIEIRGVFTNSSRVLIFNRQTGQSSALGTGDAIDAERKLVIESISGDTIEMVDHGGFRYIKRF